jgi:uncharacterized protein HemX
MAFIKKNFFQIIMTVLLTLVLGIGSYFVNKIQANEENITELQITSAQLKDTLSDIKEDIKQLHTDLGDKIEASEKSIIAKVTRCEELIDMLLVREK